MKFIRGLHQFKEPLAESVITIGNFDGVHLGHQKLIEKVVQLAKMQKIPSVLIAFEPHPKEFFSKKPNPHLMGLRDKYKKLKQLGIDYFICVHFNAAFAAIEAKDFVEQILLKKLGMRAIVLGDDFRFGARRQGDIELLKHLGGVHGFSVHQQPTLSINGERVSSTRVRKTLAEGDLDLTQQLLGRNYSISGRVTYGDQRGRTLGYPTANIALRPKYVPMTGVFIVQVRGLSDKLLPGVANLGVRPMFPGDNYLLETNIFDFDESIYGRLIEVEFLQKIRGEMIFASLSLLIAQMNQDAALARAYFTN